MDQLKEYHNTVLDYLELCNSPVFRLLKNNRIKPHQVATENLLKVSECCVAEIPEALEEELEYARDTEPEEDFRIVPLFGVLNWSDLCLSK